MTYLPTFQDQIPPHLSGVSADPLGGNNCTCYSAAMAADYDTLGAVKTTGRRIRELTGDKIGGTNLAQVDTVLRDQFKVNLDTRYRLPWAEFDRRIRQGQGAILQGWYAPIRDSRFRGSETFGENHAIFVGPGYVVMDPLCDGRRPGIYRYHGEAYPPALLKEFAGQLLLAEKPERRLGNGFVYASFTRDRKGTYAVTIPAGSRFRVYRVVGGKIVGRRFATTHAGFTTRSTQAALYPWRTGTRPRISLVRLVGTSLNGQYVSSRFAHEVHP
jgi:hypothetical protein